MGGRKQSKTKLNNTLLFVIKLLNDNNINSWFIAYGTLLGIIRENSCIDNDDDVDIITDKKNYDKIKKLLIDKGLTIEYGHNINKSRSILKTVENDEYASVDFYMATPDGKGNFRDTWERVVWSNCYNDKKELIKRIWNDNTLYLPFNYEQKLVNRYGPNWRTPQNMKLIARREII